MAQRHVIYTDDGATVEVTSGTEHAREQPEPLSQSTVNELVERERIRQAISAVDQRITNWSTMTDQQRADAMLLTLRAVGGLLRKAAGEHATRTPTPG